MQPAKMEADAPESPITSNIALTRLSIGLVQGIALYLLYSTLKKQAWPATDAAVFAPLLLIFGIVPVLLISGLGPMRSKTLALWGLSAAVVIGALAFHDIWRRDGMAAMAFFSPASDNYAALPSWALVVFSSIGFFVAHAFVLSGAQDRRFIASYATYFEVAWKLAIQLKFSALFLGMLWLVLWLGSVLFMLVKIDFLQEMITQSWFAIPVSAFALACAMHITDVRPSLVRGIRTLLLSLLSWILPIAALLVAGFLLGLPVKGLAPLWATRHATSILLTAAAVLVMLINAAMQNGDPATGVPRVVRISARIAALLLLPVTAIAIYALALRVNDYGWSADRVTAAACVFIALCYAVGYAWAACRRSNWFASLANTNIATALTVVGVLLVLFSPIGDPARLSVNSQVARLSAGKTGAATFDFDYLKREGMRYGKAALEKLKNQTQGQDAAFIREHAELALKKRDWRANMPPAPVHIDTNIKLWPQTARLPESFLKEDWQKPERRWALPRCLVEADKRCDGYLIDVNGDGKQEVLLVGVDKYAGAFLMMEDDMQHWSMAYRLPAYLAGCEPLRQKLMAGDFRLLEPRVKDIEIGGQRIEATRAEENKEKCPAQ